SVDGNVTAFRVPGASATLAYSINSSNQVTGYYVDADGVTTHGYLRASDGTLTFPIDPADSTGTVLFANNDANWVVGRYVDASGVIMGLFLKTREAFGPLDSLVAPGFTPLTGFNQKGFASCGFL